MTTTLLIATSYLISSLARGEMVGPWEWFNPDSWMDVTDHLLLVVGAWGLVAIPILLTAMMANRRQLKSANEKLEKVKAKVEGIGHQVINGHTSPMRTELDRHFAKVYKRLDAQDKTLGEVHTAVTAETSARRTAIEAINDRLGGIEEHLRKR